MTIKPEFIYCPKSGNQMVVTTGLLPVVVWNNGCRHFVADMPVFYFWSGGGAIRQIAKQLCRDLAALGLIHLAWDVRGWIHVVPTSNWKAVDQLIDCLQKVGVDYDAIQAGLRVFAWACYKAGLMSGLGLDYRSGEIVPTNRGEIPAATNWWWLEDKTVEEGKTTLSFCSSTGATARIRAPWRIQEIQGVSSPPESVEAEAAEEADLEPEETEEGEAINASPSSTPAADNDRW